MLDNRTALSLAGVITIVVEVPIPYQGGLVTDKWICAFRDGSVIVEVVVELLNHPQANCIFTEILRVSGLNVDITPCEWLSLLRHQPQSPTQVPSNQKIFQSFLFGRNLGLRLQNGKKLLIIVSGLFLRKS